MQIGQGMLMDEMVEIVSSKISEDKRVAFKNDMKMIIDKPLDKTADILIEVFTKEEIQVLLDFYDTQSGQEIQMKMPEALKKSTILGEEISFEFIPIFEQYMN